MLIGWPLARLNTARARSSAHSTARIAISVRWAEQLSPFVTVARLRLPQQDISGQDNLEKMDALSFTPWRVTAEHAPLGDIVRARKEVYRQSSIERHKLNQQPRTEPRSADEVLAPAHHRDFAGGE